MKIIIMTGRFGMGHMSAAMVIKQQIDHCHLDADAEVIDWIDYVSPWSRNDQLSGNYKSAPW